MGGRLGRYALWQARDFMMGKGAIFVIIGGLLGVAAFSTLKMVGDAWKHSPGAEAMSRQAIGGPVVFLAFIGVLAASSAIVNTDRSQGYFRFYFAKPVNLVQFYTQLWLLHGAGVLVLAAALVWLWGVVEIPVPLARIVAFFAVSYVLFGGITFLVSTLMRLDWLVTLVLWLVAQLAWTLLEDRPNVRAAVAAILPPHEPYLAVQKALLSVNAEIPAADLAWVLGYGIVCVVLGLLILRKRPMAS